MLRFVISLHVGICFMALLVPLQALSLFDVELDTSWEAYKVKYQRKYEGKEEGARRLIWENNVRMIWKHNIEADLGNYTYWLGINHFTDWTDEEMRKMRRCVLQKNDILEKTNNETKIFEYTGEFVLPSSVDWRKKGYVTPVKNQGRCGSCWAFSASGALEGQNKAKRGKLVSLSEQNLVDCSKDEGNDGCNGGWMDYAFEYVIRNKGIATEDAYPYEGMDDRCRYKPSMRGATCRKYVDVKSGSETSLQAATASVGPISVAIDASNAKFMQYKSGIFSAKYCSKTNLDHGVLVVGYGTENGDDYWIVKNSWDTTWGMDGYIYMKRNANNMCGIATKASYPVV